MQFDMAAQLEESGIKCGFDQRVISISAPENGLRKIFFHDGSSVLAKIVIDGSGPVCGFGRGEKITWKPCDLEPAYFVWAENVEMKPDQVHIYAGRELSPGGYAWVFPRGECGANIGIVLGRQFLGKVNIRHLLDDFLSSNFGNARVIQRFAGSIPCGFKKGPVAIPGLIKTGDAASTINPISRAGISEALLSGRLAGIMLH